MMTKNEPIKPSMSPPGLRLSSPRHGPQQTLSNDQSSRLRAFLDLDKEAGSAISKARKAADSSSTCRSDLSRGGRGLGCESRLKQNRGDVQFNPVKRSYGSNNSLNGSNQGRFRSHTGNEKFVPRMRHNRASIAAAPALGHSPQHNSTSNMARRIASAPALRRNLKSSGSMNSLASTASTASNCSGVGGRKNFSMVQIAQRSNGASVKAAIAEVQRVCNLAQEQHQQSKEFSIKQKQQDTAFEDDDELVPPGEAEECSGAPPATFQDGEVQPPLQECAMLAQWSVDAYYKVLISKYKGIPAIVNALNTFASCADVQAYGCSALKNMGNKLSVQEAGATPAALAALRNHPTSIHVQSECCELLQNQAPVILQDAQHPTPQESEEDDHAKSSLSGKKGGILKKAVSAGTEDGSRIRAVADELIPLLCHAKEMYLTKHGKTAVFFLLEFFMPFASPSIVDASKTVSDSTTKAAATTMASEPSTNSPINMEIIM